MLMIDRVRGIMSITHLSLDPFVLIQNQKSKDKKKTISLKKRSVKANQLSQNCFLVLVKGVANNPHVNKTFMENKKNPAAATISTTLPSVAGCQSFFRYLFQLRPFSAFEVLEADFRSSPLKANIRKSITSKVTNFRQRISSFQDKEAANQNQIELKNCGFNGNQKNPANFVIHFKYNCIQLLNENKIIGTSPFALENNASLI